MSEDDRRQSYEDAPVAGDAQHAGDGPAAHGREPPGSAPAGPGKHRCCSEEWAARDVPTCPRRPGRSCGFRGRRRLARGSRPRRRAGGPVARGRDPGGHTPPGHRQWRHPVGHRRQWRRRHARPARPAAPQAPPQEAAPADPAAPARGARARLGRVRDDHGDQLRPAGTREPVRVQGGEELDPARRHRQADRRADRTGQPHPRLEPVDPLHHEAGDRLGRGQALLHQLRDRPQGHRPGVRRRRLQAARRPGRLDDHPAVRQERVAAQRKRTCSRSSARPPSPTT